MKKDDIKHSLHQIKPNEKAKQKMLSNILNHRKEMGWVRFFGNKRFFPVFITSLVLVFGMVIGYIYLTNNNGAGSRVDFTHPDDNNIGDMDIGTEDGAYKLRDEFQIDDKHYTILRKEEKEKFGFPTELNDNDIGDKITKITTSIDERLIDQDVYYYSPAGSEAVVAVKTSNGYKLFKFYNFESYIQNQDEDTRSYLELYGINEATDIEKIQFYVYQEQDNERKILSEMVDQKDITQFYNYYSVLKNASDEYFKHLSKRKKDNTEDETNSPVDISPPDSGPKSDLEEPIEDTKEHSSPGYEGTAGNALANSVNIRIYHQSGVYYQTMYYPNIEFISRHQVNNDFSNFLENYIN